MKKVYNFLSSPKLAFLLIISIAILAFIGSIIPQGDKASVLIKLASIFDNNAESVYGIMSKFGLDDIYHSKLFFILLSIFSINLILCTIKLLPFMLHGFTVQQNYNKDFLNDEIISSSTKDDILNSLVKSNIKSITNNGVISAERNIFGRYGVIILHCGILIVLFGALLGYLFGFKGFMNVLEGDNDNVAVLKDATLIPLGFDFHLNNFDVEYYDRSDRAKSYLSNISVMINGKVISNADVDVNHPFKYNGITFYQTNFGFYPRNKNARFKLTLHNNLSESRDNISVDFNEAFMIKDNITAMIVDFAPALAVKDGSFFSASDAMINPAILIEFYDNKKPLMRGWVSRNNKSSGVFAEYGFDVEFHKYHGVQYSGFSVRKDPGRGFVYAGFFLITVGLLFIYLLNYTAIFFTIEQHGSGSLIRYRLLQQRKHALVNPAKGFINFFKR